MKNRKMLYGGLALTFMLGVTLFIQQSNAEVMQEIMVGETITSSATANPVGAGQDVLFRVINPTSNAVRFALPEVGVNYGVAPASERTFFLDMSNVKDHRIAYGIQGADGAKLASGTLINKDYWVPQVSPTALASIINYSTAYSAPIEREPQYQERPTGFNVRGYW